MYVFFLALFCRFQELSDFLLRVYPGLSKQLQENTTSHAFDGEGFFSPWSYYT